MKVIGMKDVKHRAIREIGWVGKAALLCLGILAMLALVVVIGVLTAVMLMATVFPAIAVRQKRPPGDRRDSRNVSELPAPGKAVTS